MFTKKRTQITVIIEPGDSLYQDFMRKWGNPLNELTHIPGESYDQLILQFDLPDECDYYSILDCIRSSLCSVNMDLFSAIASPAVVKILATFITDTLHKESHATQY
jgi:hypothetical protein